MSKILITHPIAAATIRELNLPVTRCSTSKLHESDFSGNQYLYVPEIGANQIANEAKDPTLKQLTNFLVQWKPDVLIVGSNAVPGESIFAWRQGVGNHPKLLIIRRGVDTRAIDLKTAAACQVQVTNLPGVNSPYVAQHMLQYLKLEKAKPNSKIAVIGTGNIGKVIARQAVKLYLDTHLYSPSLLDIGKREGILLERGINPQAVICAPNISDAMWQADYVAIAIPWLDSQGNPQKNIINVAEIENLKPNAIIVSASVPGIFAPGALNLMNKLVSQTLLTVRIDTAKRRALEAQQVYSELDIAYDQAFASPESQQALDQAMLQKARDFIMKTTS